MDRKELLKSPEYWTAGAQIELYNQARKFMKSNNMNRKKLAEYLGVSKGYVTQLLSGDYDHRMSKFFELALAFGVIPKIDFVPIEEYIQSESITQAVSITTEAMCSDWRNNDTVEQSARDCLNAYSSDNYITKEAA